MSLWGHSYTKLPQTSNLFKKHHLNHIHIYLLVFLSSVIFLFPIPPPVLGIEPRTSYILGKYLITRLHAQLQCCGFNIWFCELFLLKTRWESNCMLFHSNIFVCLRNQIYSKDYSSPHWIVLQLLTDCQLCQDLSLNFLFCCAVTCLGLTLFSFWSNALLFCEFKYFPLVY